MLHQACRPVVSGTQQKMITFVYCIFLYRCLLFRLVYPLFFASCQNEDDPKLESCSSKQQAVIDGGFCFTLFSFHFCC